MKPRTAVAAFSAAALSIGLLGTGVANASPGDWANVPGYVGPISSGHTPSTVVSAEEVQTPDDVTTSDGEKLDVTIHKIQYEDGTGQITSELVVVPNENFQGTGDRPAIVDAKATDSLDPEMSPVETIMSGDSSLSALDTTALASGYAVIIPNSYGDFNPTYAGKNNGKRIANGILAAKRSVLNDDTPTACVGFSGGAYDCGRLAEQTDVDVPGYQGTILSGTPANLSNVLDDSDGKVQSGLIFTQAMVGDFRSMSDEDKSALDSRIRPSAKWLFQNLNLGGSGSTLGTFLGLPGLKLSWLFKDGSFHDHVVQSAINEASLGHNAPDTPVFLAGNAGDNWMVWDHNGKPLADYYRDNGTDVTTKLMHKQGWPGHQDLGVADKLDFINSIMPDGSKVDIYQPKTVNSPVATGLQSLLQPVISSIGHTVEAVAPQISRTLDEAGIENVLDVADAYLTDGDEAAIAEATSKVVPGVEPEMVMDTIDQTRSTLEQAPDQVQAVVDDTAEQAHDVTNQVAQSVHNVAQDAPMPVHETIDSVASNVNTAIDNTQAAVSQVVSPAPEPVQSPTSGPSDNVTKVADQVKQVVPPQVDQVVDQVADAVSANPQVSDIVNNMNLPF